MVLFIKKDLLFFFAYDRISRLLNIQGLEVSEMPALQIAFGVVLILLAVGIIVLVLMQEGNQQGLSGAISGGSSESFFGKNKSRTNEARVGFITKIVAAAFFVLALVAWVVMLFV